MAINHIVLLAFKDESKLGPLFAALHQLKALEPGMTSFTHGPYASWEGANAGFTHAFIMVFQDAAARDRYLRHPQHERVKEEFLPFLSQVVAFDYES